MQFFQDISLDTAKALYAEAIQKKLEETADSVLGCKHQRAVSFKLSANRYEFGTSRDAMLKHTVSLTELWYTKAEIKDFRKMKRHEKSCLL